MTEDYQKKEAKAVSAIKKAIPAELKQDMLKGSKGMFAELYENDEVFPQHFMACAIDGVGTKLLLAEAMGIYDTIGIDLVAMSVNDLATLGAVSPFLYIDYLAVQEKIEENGITGDIVKGIADGLKQCDTSGILRSSIRINLGKGETASVDEMVAGLKPGYGFDVAGGMIGFIKKDKLNLNLKDGDKIIALKSSGPHSNGYTSLRLNLLKGEFEARPEFKRLYRGKHTLDDPFEGSTIGKTILEPTRIYMKTIAAIANKFNIVGVNNTGYGLKNFNRLQGFEFDIDNPIRPQPIFDLLQKDAKFSDEKMYTTFNMGMGFFIICRKDEADDVLTIAERLKEEAKIVGSVKKGQTKVTLKDKKLVLKGY